MRLRPEESELNGRWVFEGGKAKKDETCLRIEMLVKQYLQKISTDDTGWKILFRDPQDGRFWELTYPESEMHGGGPPRLSYISGEQARIKYSL